MPKSQSARSGVLLIVAVLVGSTTVSLAGGLTRPRIELGVLSRTGVVRRGVAACTFRLCREAG